MSAMKGDLPRTHGVTYRHLAKSDAYAVGSDGSVWSRQRTKGRVWRPLHSSPHPVADRLVVSLSINGRNTRPFVDLLVLAAFAPPRPAGAVPVYADGDKANCRKSNLSWGPPSSGKLDEEAIFRVYVLRAAAMSHVAIGKAVGISRHMVADILRGRSYRYLGDKVLTRFSKLPKNLPLNKLAAKLGLTPDQVRGKGNG